MLLESSRPSQSGATALASPDAPSARAAWVLTRKSEALRSWSERKPTSLCARACRGTTAIIKPTARAIQSGSRSIAIFRLTCLLSLGTILSYPLDDGGGSRIESAALPFTLARLGELHAPASRLSRLIVLATALMATLSPSNGSSEPTHVRVRGAARLEGHAEPTKNGVVVQGTLRDDVGAPVPSAHVAITFVGARGGERASGAAACRRVPWLARGAFSSPRTRRVHRRHRTSAETFAYKLPSPSIARP